MSDHVARGMTVQRQNPAYRHTVMHSHRFSQTHGVTMFGFIFKSASQTMFKYGYGLAKQYILLIIIVITCDFGYLQAAYWAI